MVYHESPGVSNNLALLLTSFPSPGTNEINHEYLFDGDKISQKREKEGKSQITQVIARIPLAKVDHIAEAIA